MARSELTATLSSLDLSFNNIRHPPSLPSQKHIRTLYLVQNKISKIEPGELDWAAETMTSLELGGNRIRVSGMDPTLSNQAEYSRLADYREFGKTDTSGGAVVGQK